MGRNCAVAGCNNSAKTGHTQHAFPKDDRQRNLWVRFVKLTRVDFTVPTKHSAICSEHFSEECYEVDRLRFKELFGLSAHNSKRLLPGSVPSNYPKRSSDVLNEGFLCEPKKKLKTSKALQKREKARVLQELLYNTPTEESKDPKETILQEVSENIPTEDCNNPKETENIPTEESNDPKETIDQVPVVIHTDTCPSPDPCDNGPESYIPMNVDPCPIDLHNDNSDGIRTTHTEVEMVNTSTTQKEADQTPKVATKKKYRSARIQVHPKTKEKCTQADFQPRIRSFGIQCNLLPTPIEPQQDNNTEERHQEHNDSGHMEHEDSVVPDNTNDPVIPDDINDPSYEPSINDSSDSGGSDNSHNELETHLQEKKFIVCEDQLMDLFKICPKCCGSANASIAHTVGTLIKVNVTCELCQHSYSWYSQPFLGSVPAGNLAVSSAILYSGALPTKVLRLMNFMNIPTISHQTFFNHQRHILYPAVLRFWKHQQMQHIAKYRDPTESLVLGGDGRADTPGHSAKYGSYSMMDLKQGVVLDIQLVQSNAVSSSNAMEKEGLIRSLKWFEDNNLQVQTLITDQHVQIVKFVREQTPHITHYFDVWHVVKGLKKKLVKISKEKDCKEVGEWIKSITNHMYWVAASTPNGDSEEMVSKWLSVANHVQNKHRGHSDQVANCLHGELVGHDRKKKWLKPGTKACVKTEELLTATRLKTSVKKLSPIHQTSDVEAFHSTINHFAPKMIGFSFHGMQCRLLLAALHFNENSARPQALSKDGVARYSIQFPKYKSGGYITREKKINQSFRYVNTLLRSIRKIVDVTTIRSTSEEPMPTPRPLCAAFTRPQKTDAIQAMKSRFRKAEI